MIVNLSILETKKYNNDNSNDDDDDDDDDDDHNHDYEGWRMYPENRGSRKF